MVIQLFQSATTKKHLKLDPRTKLFLMLIINIIMLNGGTMGEVYVKPILATVPFILLLTGREIKAALLYGTIYLVGWFAEAFLFFSTAGIANILIVMFSGLATRFMPCVIMGYYLISTTLVSEFVAAMERMHVTKKIIIPLSVMFRFFPTVAEESHAISDAMYMRGVGVRSLSDNPIALLEYRLVPLLMSVVKIGDELSAAALTRGLGSPVKRTNICKIGFGIWDGVFGLGVIAALVVYLI